MSSVSKSANSKLADDLTREAGRFTTRIAAWKRNLVAPAGKTLDRMIEKKEVPDAILDEQDRLEDATRPIESTARFGMEVVAQWKKWVLKAFEYTNFNTSTEQMRYTESLGERKAPQQLLWPKFRWLCRTTQTHNKTLPSYQGHKH
jgi:hypothetical protein